MQFFLLFISQTCSWTYIKRLKIYFSQLYDSNLFVFLWTFSQGKLFETTVSDEATWTLGELHTTWFSLQKLHRLLLCFSFTFDVLFFTRG